MGRQPKAKALRLADFDEMRDCAVKHNQLTRLRDELDGVKAVSLKLPFRSGGCCKVQADVATIRKLVDADIARCETALGAFGIKVHA